MLEAAAHSACRRAPWVAVVFPGRAVVRSTITCVLCRGRYQRLSGRLLIPRWESHRGGRGPPLASRCCRASLPSLRAWPPVTRPGGRMHAAGRLLCSLRYGGRVLSAVPGRGAYAQLAAVGARFCRSGCGLRNVLYCSALATLAWVFLSCVVQVQMRLAATLSRRRAW